MENLTITFKRTKEELRTYSIFSAIDRKPFRKRMEYIGPIMGIVFFVLAIIFFNPIFLILGIFLSLFSYMMRRTVKKSSDLIYDKQNLGDIEITMTFNEDGFLTSFGGESRDITYDSLSSVYIRNKDIIIYVSKYSGLYINKESQNEETISQITQLLTTAIPDKIKTFN